MAGKELHVLDLGAARFIELQLSLVLHNSFDLEMLKLTALKLVAAWPALSKRMNLLRTEFVPSQDPELVGLWAARTLDVRLEEALPYLQDLESHHLIDSTLFNQLVHFDESFKEQLYPRILTIHATMLRDACLLHFTVQHPFCDANGVYRIARAYSALLEGKTIDPMSPRVPLKLRTEAKTDSSTESLEPAAARHQAFFAHGWNSILVGGLRQLKNEWFGARRVEKTALIPNFVIEKLAKEAESENIRVTRHDLLMAWIYTAAMPNISEVQKKAVGPPQFSFIMNIAKLLEQDQDFHNPWIVVTVPDLQKSNLSERSPILAAAKHIREAIMDARRLAPVRQILNQHSNVREVPMGPVDWGCPEPNLAVSSWTNLALYDLEFESVDGSKVKPEFVQVGVKACPLVRMGGLSFADGILTWVGKDGFWIQGKLHEAAWLKISDFQSSAGFVPKTASDNPSFSSFTSFISSPFNIPSSPSTRISTWPPRVTISLGVGIMATIEHCLYCFETLSAALEKRTPMTLSQVQSAWAEYPKGLEEDITTLTESGPSTEHVSNELLKPRNPILNNLSNSDSGSSTPSTVSSTSLSPSISTSNTTPASSSSSFSPASLQPRQISKREDISESPLFVTWNTVDPDEPTELALRGCIGTFSSLPLSSALADYALTSALQDTRFSPISIRELPSLSVAVTLLTDFEPCATPLDWEVGVHGIKINFYAKNRRYGACYLPDVAPEQGWDQEDAVVSAMRKAGWGGRREKWREVGDLRVERYQGARESLAWPEYKAWKEWVNGRKSGK